MNPAHRRRHIRRNLVARDPASPAAKPAIPAWSELAKFSRDQAIELAAAHGIKKTRKSRMALLSQLNKKRAG